MRSPCPRQPPRSALEGFSTHGPARRRPRKTPRDPRCFVCRCYVAHRMLPRPEPALIPRKRHPSARRAPGNGPRSNLPICSVCWSADQFSSRGVGSIATRIRSYMLASTLTRSLSWIAEPNRCVPDQGSSGRESRACARFGDPTRFRRLDRYGRHLTPTSNRHQQGDDKPQQA